MFGDCRWITTQVYFQREFSYLTHFQDKNVAGPVIISLIFGCLFAFAVSGICFVVWKKKQSAFVV